MRNQTKPPEAKYATVNRKKSLEVECKHGSEKGGRGEGGGESKKQNEAKQEKKKKKTGLTHGDALAQPGGADERQRHHALRDEDDEDEHGPLGGGVVDDFAGVRKVVEGLPRDHADRLAEPHEDAFIVCVF